MKFVKRTLWIGVSLFLLLGTVYWLFSSHFLARHVARQLSEVMGMPVRIASIIPGYHATRIHGIDIYPVDDPESKNTPWITIDQIQADVSLWDGIAGTVDPKDIHIFSAGITLHLDPSGKLMTQLPGGQTNQGDLPSIHISNSRVTFVQEGHPPLTIQGIDLHIKNDQGRLVLTGSITDSQWGQWILDGNWNDTTRQGFIQIQSEAIALHQSMLESLPLVPLSIWQEINQLEGTVGAKIRLETNGPDGHLNTNLILRPIRPTRFHLQAIDLAGEWTGGTITIDGARINMDQLVTTTAGGVIDLNGELDFRQDDHARFDFQLAAQSLELVQLPGSWELPSQLTGKLSGKAELLIQIVHGQVTTTGEGKGRIEEARLAGQPARPIELKLRPAGRRFRFVSAPLTTPGVEDEPVEIAGDQGYLEVKIGLDAVDLAPLLTSLDLHLPFHLTGRLALDLLVGIPTSKPKDYSAYRLQGSARIEELRLEALHFQKMLARFHYDDGVLHLDELSGQMPELASLNSRNSKEPGTIAGTARIALFPAGRLTGQIQLQNIPIRQLAGLAALRPDPWQGYLGSTLHIDVPVERLKDLTSWQGRGELYSRGVVGHGIALEMFHSQILLENGILSLSDIQGKIESGNLTGAASIQLQKPMRYQGKLQILQADLAMVHRLLPSLDIQGPVDFQLDSEGTLEPFLPGGQLRIDSSALRIRKVAVGSIRSRWLIDSNTLTLLELEGKLFQGQLNGKGCIPLVAQKSGQMQLRLSNLDLALVCSCWVEIPVTLRGFANLDLVATLPIAGAETPREWTTRIESQSRVLTCNGIPAQSVVGSVVHRSNQLDYQLQGRCLDGTLAVAGRFPLAAEREPKTGSNEGLVRCERLQLQSLWLPVHLDETLRPLQARLNGEFRYRHESTGFPVGRGSVTLRGVKWQEQALWNEPLTMQIELTRQQLQFYLRSRFLGGQLASRVHLDLQQSRRSRYFLALDGISLTRLLAPWPDWATSGQGQIDLFLQGSLGRVCRGRGSLTMTNSRLAGVNVNEVRIPLEITYLPGNGMGQLNASDVAIQFPSGRADGSVNYNWGADNRLEGRLRFNNVDLRQAYQGSSSGVIGSPVVSGKLDLGGTDVGSFEDIVLRLEATMQRTQASQSPVLQQLTPYLLRINSATVFREGEIKAQLTHGLARIEKLSLKSDVIRMFLDGTVTIPSQRIDLSTSVYTGNLVGGACLPGLVGLSASSTQVPLASQLVAITNRLSPFLMHFQITGSLRTPTVQIRPLSALSAEAARFFAR